MALREKGRFKFTEAPATAVVRGAPLHGAPRRSRPRRPLPPGGEPPRHAAMAAVSKTDYGVQPGRTETTARAERRVASRSEAPRNSASLLSKAPERTSHSQRTSIVQPSADNRSMFRASRATLAESFARHHSCRVFGSTAFRHSGSWWWCQKQPCTNTAFFSRGNMRSGVPGRSRRWRRNLYPRLWASRRTATSGVVSLPRMRAINDERCSADMRSVIHPSSRRTGYSRLAARSSFEIEACGTVSPAVLGVAPRPVTFPLRCPIRDNSQHSFPSFRLSISAHRTQ